MALTKYCFTCKSALHWVNKQGVGTYNGFWECPKGCRTKFPPKDVPNTVTEKKPIVEQNVASNDGIKLDWVIEQLQDIINKLKK